MVNTAHSFKLPMWLSHSVLLGMIAVPIGTVALAQSAGPLATAPYLPNSVAIAPKTLPNLPAKPYRGPPPVVMFRATQSGPTPPPQTTATTSLPAIKFVDPPPLVLIEPTQQRRYSIANTAERDAIASGWDPANTDAVIAPPHVAGMANVVAAPPQQANAPSHARHYRGPVRRILQDTGRSITRDLPEAVADALPWVDRDAKNEPFDQVLRRAADDLNRASQGDPEWALPAQREIRALSQRLDLLPSPPPLAQDLGDSRPVSVAAGVDDRPFRPRPIWPGASGRPEAQVRPVTLITSTGHQGGPAVPGVAARYIPAVEDDDGTPTVQTAPRRRNGARGVPKARRAAKAD